MDSEGRLHNTSRRMLDSLGVCWVMAELLLELDEETALKLRKAIRQGKTFFFASDYEQLVRAVTGGKPFVHDSQMKLGRVLSLHIDDEGVQQ